MTKNQRDWWDSLVDNVQSDGCGGWDGLLKEEALSISAMDVYVRKLERELQALKNKKTMAALLMKKA